MNQRPPKTLTTAEVAEALGVSVRTVFTLREAKKIKGDFDGQAWKYTVDSVRAELLRRKGL